MANQNEFKGFTVFERFRLYLGGELSRLAGWIIPKVDFDSDGCQDPPKWLIHSSDPYQVTYACDFHLSEMVSPDTTLIQPYIPVDLHKEQKTCCYVSSGDGWTEVPEMEEVG